MRMCSAYSTAHTRSSSYVFSVVHMYSNRISSHFQSRDEPTTPMSKILSFIMIYSLNEFTGIEKKNWEFRELQEEDKNQ